jgi:hypothetical protein
MILWLQFNLQGAAADRFSQSMLDSIVMSSDYCVECQPQVATMEHMSGIILCKVS